MKQSNNKQKVELSQIDFSNLSLMELLRFGSGALLKEAIAAEITEYLGRGFYQHTSGDEKNGGERNEYQKTTIDTPIGQIVYDRPKVAYADGLNIMCLICEDPMSLQQALQTCT